VSAIFGLPPPLMRLLAILMVGAVIALVAWALQLMQAATDRREFSLMLAGCMVCSAAVGLSTVMVLTFTNQDTYRTQWATLPTPSSPLPSAPPVMEAPWDAITLQGAPPL